MKKLLLSAIAMACVSITSAQNLNIDINDIKWSIRVGMNISNFSDNNCETQSNYNIGVMGDLHLINRFYLQSGLMLTGRGASWDAIYSNGYTDYKMTYLQLPLTASYRIPLKKENRYFDINAGFYSAYGLWGKIEHENSGETSKIFKSSEGNFNRFDAGFHVGIGWYLKRVYLGAASEFGFTKIHKNTDWKHDVYTFTVGYTF